MTYMRGGTVATHWRHRGKAQLKYLTTFNKMRQIEACFGLKGYKSSHLLRKNVSSKNIIIKKNGISWLCGEKMEFHFNFQKLIWTTVCPRMKLSKLWNTVCPRVKLSKLWTTVCPRVKLLRFRHHIAQKVTRIWQYPFVEQNLVVFLTCVPNISKIH